MLEAEVEDVGEVAEVTLLLGREPPITELFTVVAAAEVACEAALRAAAVA